MSCELIVGVDNQLYFSGLRDEVDFVNDAVVEVEIEDIGTETMEYVAESDGVYKYVLPASAALVDGQTFTVTMRAEWTRDSVARSTESVEEYTARLVSTSYGPDVYAGCRDLIRIFGTHNINAWADLDNNEDEDVIRDRQSWALHLASRRIDERLRGGPYLVPLQLPYAATLVDVTARLAGVLLYDGARMMADSGEPGALDGMKDEIENWLGRVLDGRLRFMARSAGTRGPAVVKVEQPASVTNLRRTL